MPTSFRTPSPSLLPPLSVFAIAMVALPRAALACGDDGALFLLDVVSFFAIPLAALALLQGFARRFVALRAPSVPRLVVGVAALALAAFGALVGLAIGYNAPLLGAPLVVVELAYALEMGHALVSRVRPPLGVI